MKSQRLNVFPSRMVLMQLKERLSAAKTGWSLLKRKSDAIKANLNLIMRKIKDKQAVYRTALKEAYALHTEASLYSGNFNNQVIEASKNASLKVKRVYSNIAGVKIPKFTRYEDTSVTNESTIGLLQGGQQIAKCRKAFATAMDGILELASLQTSLRSLDDALQVTNRRVNALEFVIMPMLEATRDYIILELDEMDKEDNYRIKKVKDFRTRDSEEEEEKKKLDEIQKKRLALLAKSHQKGIALDQDDLEERVASELAEEEKKKPSSKTSAESKGKEKDKDYLSSLLPISNASLSPPPTTPSWASASSASSSTPFTQTATQQSSEEEQQAAASAIWEAADDDSIKPENNVVDLL
eukprot:TRINITY_DN1148_c0_g1_i1.p1 TRINITY_DN1148_c0_g1~~TRINITY_DN1148_c0_g1_i1.p1  ORF type:complete len:354 (+),score=94.50 TRINITY_DN1148_c0_g1_i1:110-1171(+)